MKGKTLKKAAAVLLSAALAISGSVVSDTASASASVQNPKYVKLNTSFKTLQKGQKDYRLYLKNNKAGWKIQKITVSDKSVVGAYEKKAASVKLKGKKTGSATVTLKLKTANRKKNNVKKLKCRVNVIPAAVKQEVPVIPEEPAAPVTETAVEVSNQAELDAALKNTSLKSLAIKTTETTKLVIPAGSYKNVVLSVDAPNAEIENHAVFQSITIRAIKENTWLEDAIGNDLRVEAVQARIVVGKEASVNKIEFTTANADLKLEVHGAVSSVAVSATLKIEISGDTVSVPVILTANAANTEVIASVPVQVTTDVDASFIFKEGAEGSKIRATLRSIKLTLTNNTLRGIDVTKADGTTQTVSNTGRPVTVTQSAGSTTGSYNTGTYYPGSSSGSGTGTTVTSTLPSFSIKSSVRSDTTTMGALVIDKKDILISKCANPVIKRIQYSVNHGADKFDIAENESGVYIWKNVMLGTDELEETIEFGRGCYLYVTVEDQGTEYTGLAMMNFGQILEAGNVKTFTGIMAKKSSITMSFQAEIISGSAIAAAPDKGWIRTVIPFDQVQFSGGTSPQITGGSNRDEESNMTFQLVKESGENRWMSEKNGQVSYDKLLEQVQTGTQQNRSFLYMIFYVSDNGKKYAGAVSTKYGHYFANAESKYGTCHYTVQLYEIE